MKFSIVLSYFSDRLALIREAYTVVQIFSFHFLHEYFCQNDSELEVGEFKLVQRSVFFATVPRNKNNKSIL